MRGALWILAIVGTIGAVPLAAAQLTPNAAGTIAITSLQPLSFGAMIVGGAGGSLTVGADGTQVASGVFPVGAVPMNPAQLLVEVTGGANPHYIITLPASTQLVSTRGDRLTVDTFHSIPAGVGRAEPPVRQDVVTVGATLWVPGAQPPGIYSGTYPVTVNLGN